MITAICHSKEWIQSKQKEHKVDDPILLEKVIHAFVLLEALKAGGLDFIFKGGTSMLLLLDEPHRFSIDIDIIIPGRKHSLSDLFKKVVEQTKFYKVEEDERYSGLDIPKAHYKFYYQSVLGASQENAYILLDILYEKNPYPSVIEKEIRSPFLSFEGKPVQISLPNINSILGDKLTAFAPKTIGVPYQRGKRDMTKEIMKQLYDLGSLFNLQDNPEEIKRSFLTVAEKEIGYRELKNCSPQDVLDDSIRAGHILSARGKVENTEFQLLTQGISKLKPFIYGSKFQLEDAIIAVSKVSYLATLLKQEKLSRVAYYSGVGQVTDLMIPNAPPYNMHNKLKKALPEAFYYWYQTVKLMGG
ncbi:MAG: nucleotidyl transferase AbiEii/AbiGii toxin family protein [Flavobacteriales bacterium]|nr:nucleotidyl transferase AbiEii/AbiGii toxin family protein [Flavobacteriales bacterium]